MLYRRSEEDTPDQNLRKLPPVLAVAQDNEERPAPAARYVRHVLADQAAEWDAPGQLDHGRWTAQRSSRKQRASAVYNGNGTR